MARGYRSKTENAEQDRRLLSEDWTEVVSLGNEPEQDTVRDPYTAIQNRTRNGQRRIRYHRSYELPKGVKATLLKGTNKLDGNRQVRADSSALEALRAQ